MCIICFLKERFQYELRDTSQIRSDRFEHTIFKYRSSFIREFKNRLTLPLCENHNNTNNKEIFSYIKDINIRDVDIFFKKLLEIHVSWINAELSNSIKLFNELLGEYNLLDKHDEIGNLVLFRGRRSKEFISHWDMFHIPFNKRFCIGNQRYSLVGQPLLYLATSPYCVYRELESSEELKISSFRLKHNEDFRIFNNTNLFYRHIKENNDNSAIAITDNMIEDSINKFNGEEIKRNFFLLILASCCSFKRRSEFKGSSFCEEYVLPQILAQIVKCEGFDGIMYTSTKAYYDDKVENNETLINAIYKNISIFTNYDKERVNDVTYVYDKNLYDKFVLSAPLIFNMNIEPKYYSIKESLEIIQKISSYKNDNKTDEDVIYNINELLILYVDGENLKEKTSKFTIAKNLHCLLLRNIILNIVEELEEGEIENE